MSPRDPSAMVEIQLQQSTIDQLMKLSTNLELSLDQVINHALTELKQTQFIDQVVADFESLMSNPEAMHEYNWSLSE